jgi:deazaflavin-dependent oxidoreductase (nitroreductase family)
MTWLSIQDIADKKVLYLTTVGRRSGLPREIEIWFVIHCDRFYLFSETGEAAAWVKNIRCNPEVVVRIKEPRIRATARVLDREIDRSCGRKSRRLLNVNMNGVTGCRWKLPPLCLARPPSTPLRQPRAAELAMRGESYLGHSNRGSQRTTETAGAYPPIYMA